jgi:hypothetical protein
MDRRLGLTLILFFAPPVYSQRPVGGPPPIDRHTNAARTRMEDESRREWQLRNFGKEPGAPKDRREVEAIVAQTEEDFNRILTLHNEIARAIAGSNDLNYHFVSTATAEIKKRASRVQSNLALGVSEQEAEYAKKKDTIKDAQLKDSLIRLCKEIRSFVTNPTIADPSTVDAQQLTKARLNLESLIQLSGQIKKDADRLEKQK